MNRNNINQQYGFTLVELLVGLTLGLFLTAAVIQSYLSTKATSRTTNSVNRVQENSRFAYHLLSRDLRETSSLGCLRSIRDMSPSINQLTDLRIKVGGWDYDNTSAGDEIDLSSTYAVTTNRNNWSGINDGSGTTLPNFINSIDSSDVILIKKITQLSDAVISQTSGGSEMTSINIANHTPNAGDTLIVGDCQTADKFIVNSVNSVGTVNSVTANSTSNFIKNWGNSASVFSVSYVSYYVGYRTGARTPSLYRDDFATGSPAQELVDDVENIQLLYGIDLSSDGFANRYISASAITDWTNVVSVRVGFLYVSPPQAAAAEETYNVADAITFRAAANDLDLRYVSNATIKTRNLGLTENFDVCFASNTDASNATCNTIGYVVRTTP